MNQEVIYDEQIFPLMKQVISICKENKIAMHFTACLDVQDENDEPLYVSTHIPGKRNPFALRLMYLASQTRNNFDLFVMAIMRYAKEQGHESAVLKILGVPVNPE